MDELRKKEAWMMNVDHYVNMLLTLYDVHVMDVVDVEHERMIKNLMLIEQLMMHHNFPIQVQVIFLRIK
jgi:hypothetical protein